MLTIDDLPDDIRPEDIPLGFAVRELREGIDSGQIPRKYEIAIDVVRRHLKETIRDAIEDAPSRVEPLDAVGPVSCGRHPEREAIVQSSVDDQPMCEECMDNVLGLER